MRVAKSVSIDEETAFESQKKAREQGISFSEYVELKLNESEKSKEEFDLNYLNNNIILLNNKIILLCKQYTFVIEEEIKKKQKEIQELKEKKKQKQKEILNNITKIQDKLTIPQIKLIDQCDFSNNIMVFDMIRKIKDQNSEISAEEIRVYAEYLEQAKEFGIKVKS